MHRMVVLRHVLRPVWRLNSSKLLTTTAADKSADGRDLRSLKCSTEKTQARGEAESCMHTVQNTKSSHKTPAKFVLDESELRESFIKGWGCGGQKINKVRNCVQLVHVPTGLQVDCQEARELVRNRALARTRLAEKVEHHYQGKDSAIGKRIQKLQRSKSRSKRKHAASAALRKEGERET